MTDQGARDSNIRNVNLSVDDQTTETIVAKLAAAIAQAKASLPASADDKAALRADYQTTLDVVKLLSDMRFRCLVFVTAVIAVANALLPGTGAPGTRIALGTVGFLATLGITVYELRNSQLYEAAIHRAKFLERRLEVPGSTSHGEPPGLFNERPYYVEGEYWKNLHEDQRTYLRSHTSEIPLMRFLRIEVKHDRGLALIYGAALGGWVYLIADGILSLPVEYLPFWLAGWARLVAATIGIWAFVGITASFIHHDEARYRPQSPRVGAGTD